MCIIAPRKSELTFSDEANPTLGSVPGEGQNRPGPPDDSCKGVETEPTLLLHPVPWGSEMLPHHPIDSPKQANLRSGIRFHPLGRVLAERVNEGAAHG